MGTHDLDKFSSDEPITYEAVAPKDIVFVPLKRKDPINAEELFKILKNDIKMKKFLPILEGFDKYPVFYDKHR
jgi:phenylalanyl-tRNA synthetase beta chain